MNKLEKKEGNEGPCWKCGQTIFCRIVEKSGNYPSKLQWQDKDGKAHYNFNFDTKESTCGKTQPKESLGVTMPKANELDIKVLERIRTDAENIAKQKIAKFLGVKKACNDCGIDNPAQVGMIFNAVDREEIE